MKKILSIILSLTLIFVTASSCFAVVYGEDGWEYEGITEDTAWEINSAKVLIKVRDDINSGKVNYIGYYKLTKNIDLSSYTDWEPIGKNESYAFKGHFNGNGHTITVNITRKSNDEDRSDVYTGLFGWLTNGGSIKNLSVKGNIKLTLIGQYATGWAAGVVARMRTGTIDSCTFDGNVNVASVYRKCVAGGIVGEAGSSEVFKITNCKVGSKSTTSIRSKTGTASQEDYEGGIIGFIYYGNSGSEIKNNWSKVILGGVCDYSDAIYGRQYYGSCVLSSNTTVEAGSTQPVDSSYKPVVYGETGWEYEGLTEDTAWIINSAKVLEKVRDDINNGTVKYIGYYKLTKNIDLSSYTDWTPIGKTESYPFIGHFNGDGHTITVNITRKSNDEDRSDVYTGLFGWLTNGGSIKNLSVKGNIKLTLIGQYATGWAAGIVARMRTGTVDSCTFDGNVNVASVYRKCVAGGIVGEAGSSEVFKITNCKVGSKSTTSIRSKTGTASQEDYEGGIIGFIYYGNSGSEIKNNWSKVILGGVCDYSDAIYGRQYYGSCVLSNNTTAEAGKPKTDSSYTPVVYGETGWEYEGLTEDTAWIINSAKVLEKVRDDINNGTVKYIGYYKLTKDINLTSYTDWEPIGKTESYPFIGHFNGDGHTVKVNITRRSNDEDRDHVFVGLFGWLTKGGSIKNLSVKGDIKLTMIGQYANGWAAGVVARMRTGTVDSCTFDGNVNVTSVYKYCVAGGIVGEAGSSEVFKINNCKVGAKSTTSIKSKVATTSQEDYEGGIIGHIYYGNAGSEVKGNWIKVTLGGTCDYSGAVYGRQYYGSCVVSGNTVVDPGSSETPPEDPEDPDPEDPDDPSDDPTDDPIDEPDDSILDVSLDFNDTVEVGDYYKGTATVSGGKKPYQWDYEGDMPPGLELTANAKGTKATVSGHPTEAGEYTLILQVTDKNGEEEEEIVTITVIEPEIDPLEISESDFEEKWLLRKAYSGTAKVKGGVAPYTWSIDGELPPGLELADPQDENWTEAEISGKPVKAGTYSFTLVASDSEGNSVETDEITITITAPKISGTFEKSWLLKKSYSSYIKVSGGEAPYKASKSSGTLPNGLKLSVSGSKVYLKGTPSAAGNFTFKVKVKDNNGATVSKSYTVTITAPEISGTFNAGKVGKTYTGTAKVSGGTAPYTWKYSGIPAGLEFNSNAKGTKITFKGKPTKAKTYSAKLTVTDKNGAKATKTFTFKIKKSTAAKTLESSQKVTTPLIFDFNYGDGQNVTTELTLLEVFEDDILIKGEGKDEDLVTVKANQPVRFIIGEWPVDVLRNEIKVFVDDKLNDEIKISEENTFTIPSEISNGDFKVQVKAGELETNEIFISTTD